MTAEPSTTSSWRTGVVVRGARQNNLKDVAVELPRDAIVVFTGVSGSGKSSLAFGTLYAESQRRYLESVAPYARRLIDQAGVPDVDVVEGLPPAVALEQQRTGGGARSDVATLTTLSSVVRMLYSRAGWYPPDQPMLYAEDFSANTAQGACPRCHGIGRVYAVPEHLMVPDPTLTIRERAVASWPVAWAGQNQRDILVALGYDVDTPWQDLPAADRDWILHTEERPTVGVYPGLTPEQTRRAQRQGREPSYQGTFIGARRYVLDTFANARSASTRKRAQRYLTSETCPECRGRRIKAESLTVTFEGHDIAELSHLPLARVAEIARAVTAPDWQPREATDQTGPDAALDASRRAERAATRIAGGGASHAAAPDVRRTPNLSTEKRAAAQLLAGDLAQRLQPMIDLGLGYLSLDRLVPTLSGGERQRVRLATQLSSKLFGVVYVLDEPSAGLHPRDLDQLVAILHGLKDRGNSVFVVEHSLRVISEADWLVDLGPGAGSRGGRVVYSGVPEGLARVPESVTRRYLFPEDGDRPAPHQPRTPQGWFEFTGLGCHTVHDLDVRVPAGCLTAVTGISGSGKSSLVGGAIPAALRRHLGQAEPEDPETDDEADLLLAESDTQVRGRLAAGPSHVRRVVVIDQKPIGRTPRSNVATYTGVFDDIRKLFAGTDEARRRGYKASRFSFNVSGGRCPTCEGEGSVMVELLFLPSIYTPCPDCHGTRYQQSTLEVTWHDRSVADVLAMSVDEAFDFFADHERIHHALGVLRDVRLGYLVMGQPAPELSGGEAQRVKLAAELRRPPRGDTLYVLDEPTAGLHPADSDRLVAHLQSLVEAGNTVVMAELDMRMVARADHVIDMGPGAGADGGRVVASGTPAEVAACPHRATAPYLAAVLADQPAPPQEA